MGNCKIILMLCVLLCIEIVNPAIADITDAPLKVGVRVVPPFVIRHEDGSFSGLSIDIWQHIATEQQLNYEFQELSLPLLLDGLKENKLDIVVAAVTVTAEREQFMDFSHPFLSSGLGIAVAKQRDTLGSIVRAVFSIEFLHALATLFAVLTIIAIIIWLLERKANPHQFLKAWGLEFGGQPSP